MAYILMALDDWSMYAVLSDMRALLDMCAGVYADGSVWRLCVAVRRVVVGETSRLVAPQNSPKFTSCRWAGYCFIRDTADRVAAISKRENPPNVCSAIAIQAITM